MEKLNDTTVHYSLPESFTGGRTYWMQFGQRYQYPAAGDHIFHARLPTSRYANARLDLILANTGSAPMSLCLDMGNDGACDWTYSGSPTLPFTTTATSLTEALTTFMLSAAPDPDGTVVVPIRVNLNTSGELFLTNLAATPSANIDLALSSGDITFGVPNPAEGDTVPVQAMIHNQGNTASRGVTASFYATAPAWGETYIGSDFIPGVAPGQAEAATIDWNTLGFTGTVPVKVVVDPYDRLAETNETNNEATRNITSLTRPDLKVMAIDLSNDEPIVGESVAVTLTLANAGQTPAAASTLALYDGEPDQSGVQICTGNLPVPAGGQTTLLCFWTPTATGSHRLVAIGDQAGMVSEYDETNNQTRRNVYIGFAGPIEIDSGLSASDPPYTTTIGYGVVDVDVGTSDILGNCGADPYQTYRLDASAGMGQVVYRFDHLLPGHFYHLDLTLYDCNPGTGREEYVAIDDMPVAGPVDLGDGEIHFLSILIDPALYADNSITVAVQESPTQGSGALVNEISLHDVDYRYADGGGANDPAYPFGGKRGKAFGYLDGSPTNAWGTLPYQIARRDLQNNDVRYKYDGLSPSKRYQMHFTFYQGSGTNRVQQVWMDTQAVGEELTIVSGQRYTSTLEVPLSAYSTDGSVEVRVVRNDTAVLPIVNEIALEEETQVRSSGCQVVQTPAWTTAFGSVTIAGQQAPPGTQVTAESPRGETVGCFVVQQSGLYGFMNIYGAFAGDPGMLDGERVLFRVNGALAVASPPQNWHEDKTPHRIDLLTGVTQSQSTLLTPGWNLFSFYVEPPIPLVATVLSSITGRYCRVLAEAGIYDCAVPSQYHSLRDLHAGKGYYLRLTGATSANLIVEGVPLAANTPLPLHAGWNWVGYLPRSSLPVATALQSIAGSYLWVTDGVLVYDPANPGFSTLQTLVPGDGYLVYARQPVTLTYPTAEAQSLPEEPAPAGASSVCQSAQPTPNFTLLFGDLRIDGAPAPAGTRVELLTPRGDVAGCFVVDQAGAFGFVPVYGEDPGTPPIPGFREGEAMAMRVNAWLVAPGSLAAWSNDRQPHRLDLDLLTPRRVFLPSLLH